MDLSLRIAAADAAHIPDVGLVHADEQVPVPIVLPPQLPGQLALAADAVLGQLPAGRRIDRVADLLSAGGGRFDVKFLLQSRLFHQIFHNKLGHRAPANIAVAHKKHSNHVKILIF